MLGLMEAISLDFPEALKVITGEIGRVTDAVDPAQVAALVERIREARRVFITGGGRSGLVAKAFANRLVHLSIPCAVVGETTAPPITAKDLLLVVSGSGETPTMIHFTDVAREQDASVAAIVADPESTLARTADAILVVPGSVKTGAGLASSQMRGSAFEQAAFVILEAMVLMLGSRLGESEDTMRPRHTNLE